MLTSREKKFIIVFIIITILALYYNFIFIPQVIKIRQLNINLNNYKQKLNLVEEQILSNSIMKTNYKVLNDKISRMYKKYFPIIYQEKMIILLDDMIIKTNINCTNIIFSEPQISPLDEENEDIKNEEEYQIKILVEEFFNKKQIRSEESSKKEEGNKKSLPKVEGMKVDIEFTGNYNSLFNFVKLIEEYEKKILIRNLNITADKENNLIGNIQLEFLSMPKIHQQDQDFLTWNPSNSYGREGLFNTSFDSTNND